MRSSKEITPEARGGEAQRRSQRRARAFRSPRRAFRASPGRFRALVSFGGEGYSGGMNAFVKRAARKLSKLTPEQTREIIETLSEEKETQDAVLDSLETGLIVCGPDGGIMRSNRAAARLAPFSPSPADAPGAPVWELIADASLAAFVRSLWDSQAARAQEFTLPAADGASRHIAVSSLPLIRGRNITGKIIKLDDITEQFNRELLLRRMENLAGLTNLAANVAHEIKNPLGSISIHIQLMQKALAKARAEGAPPEEKYAERCLEVVTEEIERLNSIIVDFLMAVRPVRPEFAIADPDALVRDYAAFIAPELERAGVRIALALEAGAGGESPRVMLDGKLFKQVILNLAQNAGRAMPRGGKLTFSSKVKNGRYLLTVADTGEGMDEKTLARIFEPYFTTRIDGTGLGLTMVYKIIREFFGEIGAVSEKGEGTAFIISLPLRLGTQRLLPEGASRAGAGGAAA